MPIFQTVKKINHGAEYEETGFGKRSPVTMKTQKSDITVELADIDLLIDSNKLTKKLFVFTLTKANECAINNGYLARDGISFLLQTLSI